MGMLHEVREPVRGGLTLAAVAIEPLTERLAVRAERPRSFWRRWLARRRARRHQR